jgi:polysaccharide biosynthesis protein PslH
MAPRFPNVAFVIPGIPIPEGLTPRANVSFPGYARDTRELYRRPNTIIAAPLFSGTGQRVKLLEAFAMACPVVTTTVGAMGFPITDSVQAMIANTVDEFDASLRRLIASQELRVQLGNCGRQMILDGFTWDEISRSFWDVVAQAAVSN